MFVIPAIDIKDGRCVRLRQGDMENETVFSEDPVAMARHWADLGATRLHLVDLNGARSGSPKNEKIIREICREVGDEIPVQLGGGIRDMDTIERYLEGFYRFGDKKYDIGFRGGFADANPGRTQFLAGVDFRTRVIDHSADFPLDGAVTAGIGGRFGNGESQAYIPFGLSLGRRVALEDSNVEFTPYFHPVLGPTFGDGNYDSGLLFGLGLGVDVSFNKKFDIRVSGALGDYNGIGISFAILR